MSLPGGLDPSDMRGILRRFAEAQKNEVVAARVAQSRVSLSKRKIATTRMRSAKHTQKQILEWLASDEAEGAVAEADEEIEDFLANVDLDDAAIAQLKAIVEG